ncbi:MAG: DMT family transporter [Niabella sp.]
MRKAFVQLHIAVLLAGFTGVLGRLITLNEVMIVWYRLLITAATVWILVLVGKQYQRISARTAMKIAGVGFISAAHWISFYASIKNSNISVGVVCLSAVGFFSSFLEPVLNKKRINYTEVWLGVLSILGIYLIFHFDTRYKVGIIYGVISSFLASLFTILLKMALRRTNSQTVITWQMTGGFVFTSIVLAFYLKLMPGERLIPTMSDTFWLFVLAWLCSVVAFQFSMSSLKKLSAFTVGLSYNLEPLYGVLMAFLIYKEGQELNIGFYLGVLLIGFTVIYHSVLLKRQQLQGIKK